jgi:anthranilate 1,2-dioxygenase large subunit
MYSGQTVIGRPGTVPKEREGAELKWPEQGLTSIPDWVYTSEDIYAREVERIFHGKTWNYVGLEAEIPNTGDFKRSYVGPTPVIVARNADGTVHVFENRCAHRGVEFCRSYRGNATEFVCPYHQWSYDLCGNLQGVPFKRGFRREGGMPKDFRNEDHGLRKLKVTTLHGVIFASFGDITETIEEYLGPEILPEFEAVFKDRKIKILGWHRNELPGNWKLYQENLKDPYHGTLLHVFLVTFGLFVAGNKSAMIVGGKGKHGIIATARANVDESLGDAEKKEMRAFRADMKLNDPRFLNLVEEFASPWTAAMHTIWPNMIIQRELNTLGTRQIVPNGPNSQIMIWTMFGYEDDSPEMTRHRLRQGSLMGPAGFLGVDDNEAMKFLQEGVRRSASNEAVVKLGGDSEDASSTLITESAIRSMYRHYREVMGI